MTAEQRVLIEVKDIAGFEFECPRCKSRVYVPIDKYDGLLPTCANCRERWFGTVGGPEHIFIHELLEHLKNYRRQQPPAVKLRLQLEPKLTEEMFSGRERETGRVKTSTD